MKTKLLPVRPEDRFLEALAVYNAIAVVRGWERALCMNDWRRRRLNYILGRYGLEGWIDAVAIAVTMPTLGRISVDDILSPRDLLKLPFAKPVWVADWRPSTPLH